MLNGIKWILLACSLGFTQSDTLKVELDISTPSPRQEYTLFTIPEIGSALVLHWVEGVTACPREGVADFLLEKLNPEPGTHLIKTSTGNTCHPESLTVKSGFVYVIHTISGKPYYLKVIEGDENKLKVAITSANPTALVERHRPKAPSSGKILPANTGTGFEANGVKVTGSATPVFKR